MYWLSLEETPGLRGTPQLVKRLRTRYQSRATILLDLAVLSANVGDRREA
ncbi:MAG TPA: hypothetical protein VGD69_05595 [Herpetosiphonaceae bacterium]